MKIKIFASSHAFNGVLESAVNDFISDKKVIDIKQSECADAVDFYSFTLTVLYEEAEKAKEGL